MKYCNLTSGNPRAILIFAGWAMDSTPFMALSRKGYDIVVVYDYTEQSADFSFMSRYCEIIVIGWSMGVLFGEDFIRNNVHLPVTATIAINGSPYPRHDSLGIPEVIYDATAAISSDRQLTKFYTRVCGGAKGRDMLMPQLPSRGWEDAVEELKSISLFASKFRHDASLWDAIFISAEDAIFPCENLQRAWADAADRVVLVSDEPHFPSFVRLLNKYVMDKQLVSAKFSGAMNTYDSHAHVQQSIARHIAELLPPLSDIDLLEVGSGTGILTELYQTKISNSRITAIDIAGGELAATNGNSVELLIDDAEIAVRRFSDSSFRAILSSSAMQWFNSPLRFLQQLARLLQPGGVAVIATYGKATLRELCRTTTSYISLPYLPVEAYQINIPGVSISIESEFFTLDFQSPAEALRHLRLTGVNATTPHPLSLAETHSLMRSMVNDNGRTTLTFEAIYIRLLKE